MYLMTKFDIKHAMGDRKKQHYGDPDIPRSPRNDCPILWCQICQRYEEHSRGFVSGETDIWYFYICLFCSLNRQFGDLWGRDKK
jgi:hypothetical protein